MIGIICTDCDRLHAIFLPFGKMLHKWQNFAVLGEAPQILYILAPLVRHNQNGNLVLLGQAPYKMHFQPSWVRQNKISLI